jgi:tetratricopeptide (TPR) repeat protein
LHKQNDAITQFKRVLRIHEELYGVNHIQSALTIRNLGLAHERDGNLDLAIEAYERALSIYAKAPAEHQGEATRAREMLARVTAYRMMVNAITKSQGGGLCFLLSKLVPSSKFTRKTDLLVG